MLRLLFFSTSNAFLFFVCLQRVYSVRLNGGYRILAFKSPLAVFMQNGLLLLKAAHIPAGKLTEGRTDFALKSGT